MLEFFVLIEMDLDNNQGNPVLNTTSALPYL